MRLNRRKHIHDAFLSHAVEDRADIADELYNRLHSTGLGIWYSGRELIPGNYIEDDIEKAVDDSRFGIVIFSKRSLNRPWLVRELSWLKKKETSNKKIILPILHDLTIEEFRASEPVIGSRMCINASRGMDYVIEKIVEEIRIRFRNEVS